MHKPDPIETILARLMPPGLSDGGQHDIEAMLDELAGEEISAAPAAPKPWFRRAATAGIAAAGVAVACIFPITHNTAPVAQNTATQEPVGIVLVSESDRVESMTDEGWQENADGSAMRAMRLSVVEENNLLDEETGIVMQITEPREEFLLVPVSTF